MPYANIYYIVYRMDKKAATPNNDNMVKKCIPLTKCCVGGEGWFSVKNANPSKLYL